MFQTKMQWRPEDLILVSLVVRQLALLRQSFEEIGGKPHDQMAFALVLADVCDALCLDDQEKRKVLGFEGMAFLTEWGDTPVGLAEEQKSAPAVN